MNDAVYKFRRYEDTSLEYTGLNRHEYDSSVGLFDTALSAEDYAQMKLQDSLLNPDGTTRDRDSAMVVTSEVVDARQGSGGDKPRKRVQVLDLGGGRGDANAPREAKSKDDISSKRDWVYDTLADEGLELIDARGKDGCLWVVGGGELDAKMGELASQGARFRTFSVAARQPAAVPPGGSRATLRWQPPSGAAPGRHGREARRPGAGDTVFHKAFGYGEVVDIDREHGTIEVVIGLNKKGKPKHRKFLFPNVFEQGLLTV